MTLRRAVERDLDALLALEHECIAPPWSAGSMLYEILNPDAVFLVAEDAETMIGFAVLRESVDAAEVFRVAVTENARRRGIGAALLRELVETAGSDGMQRLYLEVRASNAAAIALYERFGFRWQGVRSNYYDSPVEDALVLLREKWRVEE